MSEAAIGHNSESVLAADKLRSLVERIERLVEEKKAIASDIGDVYTEANGQGFDKKALRMIVRLRSQDVDEREQFEGVVDTYKAALGME